METQNTENQTTTIDSTTTSSGSSDLNNETIVRMMEEVGGHDQSCVEKLVALPDLNDAFLTCNRDSLRKKIGSVFSKFRSLKRSNKKQQLAQFLKNPFCAPSTASPQPRKNEKYVAVAVGNLKQEVKALQEELGATSSALAEVQQAHAAHDQDMMAEKCKLQKKIKCLEQKYQNEVEVTAQLHDITADQAKKLSKLSTRNVNKRIKRQQRNNEDLEMRVKKLCTENLALRNELQEAVAATEKLQKLREERLSMQKKISALKCQVKNLVTERVTDTQKLELENKQQREQIKALEDTVLFLEGNEKSSISTLCGRKYNATVREVCMTLLTECNVSIRKLPEVIKIVMSKLAGMEVDKLPSAGTLSNMFIEAGIVASNQVATAMLKDFNIHDTCGNVLHQDATTKFHRHYEGMQTTCKDGTSYTLGLSQTACGDAKAYGEVFDNIITDLAVAHCSGEKDINNIRTKLITSFRSFMNDRCAVNGVLTSSIETLRTELLPAVVENFESLPPAEQSELSFMGHYACRMHLLANFAPAADKGLKTYEECAAEGINPHSFKDDISGTLRLIQTAAKAFTSRGCDKSGVNNYFEAFLQDRQKTCRLKTFHGHRFNIMFENAAAVYFHRHDIKTFLESWPNPNRLLQSVKFDVAEDLFLAGVRGLGILYKHLMEPFHHILNSQMSILEITSVLQELHALLQKWSEDGTEALLDQIHFRKNETASLDQVRAELFLQQSSSFDALTILAIEMASTEMLILLERQAESQLEGGNLCQPTSQQTLNAQNVPCSNIRSEQDMGRLDNLIKTRPSASVETLQACVMWQANKPSQWLSTLSEKAKEKVITSAQQRSQKQKALFQKRREQLKIQCLQQLKTKQEEKENKEEKEALKKIKITREIQEYGGLWTLKEIKEKLNRLDSEKEKRKALISQLKFYKNVVQVKLPRHLFQQTADGKPYDLSKLEDHLVIVVQKYEDSLDNNEDGGENKLQYKETEETTRLAQEHKSQLFKSLLEARRKRQNKSHVMNDLPEFLERPEDLVDKRVQHKCSEEDRVEWFSGTVKGIWKRHKDAIKTEYSIIYDETPNDSWHFPLLLDMKRGDLVLM